jgi:hypothetical protein
MTFMRLISNEVARIKRTTDHEHVRTRYRQGTTRVRDRRNGPLKDWIVANADAWMPRNVRLTVEGSIIFDNHGSLLATRSTPFGIFFASFFFPALLETLWIRVYYNSLENFFELDPRH